MLSLVTTGYCVVNHRTKLVLPFGVEKLASAIEYAQMAQEGTKVVLYCRGLNGWLAFVPTTPMEINGQRGGLGPKDVRVNRAVSLVRGFGLDRKKIYARG